MSTVPLLLLPGKSALPPLRTLPPLHTLGPVLKQGGPALMGGMLKPEGSILPTIGTVNAHALKKVNKNLRVDKQEYLAIPLTFLAFFAGLIDGDGYIQITRTKKGFIAIKLVISIHLNDISTLEYCQSVLKVGKLTVYKDIKSPSCKLIINRTDLQEVIFPLFLHHNIYFLTETRRAQFDLCMFIIKHGIKNYDKINTEISSTFELPKTPEGYLNLAFFND